MHWSHLQHVHELNLQTQDGTTVLHQAVKAQDVMLTKHLLDVGAPLAMEDGRPYLLQVRIYNVYCRCSPLFDSCGACMQYGWTSVHLAAYTGNIEILTALIDQLKKMKYTPEAIKEYIDIHVVRTVCA